MSYPLDYRPHKFKIQEAAKAVFADLDLYGLDCLEAVLLKYNVMSFRKGSIPSPGSRSWVITEARRKKAKRKYTKVLRLICHRDGSTTIQTDKGFGRFWP